MTNTPKFHLLVSCMTYNQANYITDAMNGFVMQQTTFPFVCTIVDDASTDGEQMVIKNYIKGNFDLQDSTVAYEKDTDYGHVTFARHKTNENCYFAVIYLKENHYSQKKSKAPYLTEWMDTKYIALCEGDDYWIDPLKLQKQVDYMESYPKCSCCAHNSLTLNTQTRDIRLFNKKILNIQDYTLDTFLTNGWFTPTQSLLYRQCNYQLFDDMPRFMHGDYSLLINILLKPQTYLHYDNQIMSVYRDGGWASSNYKELDLYNDFIALLTYFKGKSNHRCDDIFDEQIACQQRGKEKCEQLIIESNKPRPLHSRIKRWIRKHLKH